MPQVGDDIRLAKQLQGKRAGGTVQLAHDFLTYARERFDVSDFKQTLAERLLPTVPCSGDPHPIAPRTQFGKFDVRGRLGKGGMAEVYLVYDPELAPDSTRERDHLVALKVMKDTIAHDPNYVTRFLREAANTALIDHHNVVRVHEVGSVHGRLYFTMELIEGETLKDFMSRSVVEEDTGVQILCQLVDGIMAAHEREIGHRDLKPSNVMVVTSQARYGYELADEFDVAVKVTDFGLAEMLDTDVPTDMPEGRFLGTAKYVAPEVVRGESRTLKSDVFSLGILAFQMFAGRAPFRARNKLEYITANLNAEAPPLASLAEVTPELSRVIDNMLVKDPAQRQDAEALRRDLGRLILREQVGDAIVVHDDPESVFHTQRRAAPAVEAGSDTTRLLIGGGVVVGVLLLGLLGALIGRSDPPPSPTPSVASATPTHGSPPASVEPSTTRAPATGGVLAPVPAVPPSAFSDRLARMTYTQALEAGDAAWRAEDHAEAYAQWTRAVQLCPRQLEPLNRRVREATQVVAMQAAADHEREADFRAALSEVERAAAAGAEVGADLRRLQGLIEQGDEFDRRLVAARQLEEQAAIDALIELLPLAKRIRRDAVVHTALERLGIDPDEVSQRPSSPATPSPTDVGETPTSPPDVPADPAARLRAEALLASAEDSLDRGDLAGAERALRAAERHVGPTDASRALWQRLEEAR